MNRVRVFLGGILVALSLVVGGLFVTVSTPAPAEAAILNSVNNLSASNRTLTVCRDLAWSWSKGTYCKAGLGSLKPGEGTGRKYGWSGVDGVWVTGGCSYTSPNPPVYWAPSKSRWYWVNDFSVIYVLYRC